jgi:hypothetical protein
MDFKCEVEERDPCRNSEVLRGFIAPDGDKDVFVHVNTVERCQSEHSADFKATLPVRRLFYCGL